MPTVAAGVAQAAIESGTAEAAVDPGEVARRTRAIIQHSLR